LRRESWSVAADVWLNMRVEAREGRIHG